MRINGGTLSKALARTAAKFIESGDYASAEEINEGGCDVFAEAIYGGFDFTVTIADIDDAGLEELDMVSLLVDDRGGAPFDRDAISARWPWISPPNPMTWDDLDRLSAGEHFHASAHVFLHMGGRFYDAESPSGVASFLDLGFFARRLAAMTPSVDGYGAG